MKFRFLVSPIKKDLGTQPQPFVYVYSIVLSEYNAQPAKPKIFPLWPISGEFADPWVKRTVPLNRIWETRLMEKIF